MEWCHVISDELCDDLFRSSLSRLQSPGTKHNDLSDEKCNEVFKWNKNVTEDNVYKLNNLNQNEIY